MTNRRILIFGASGFTGGNLAAAALRQSWQVAAVGRTPVDGLEGAARFTADITEPGVVEALFDQFQPRAVVNLAALANIDLAEREHEAAWQINVLAARTVAECCARRGARCIYLSSDAVFDGSQAVNREEDPPNPLNYYGVTKAEGEKQVFQACPDSLVVRVSLILGYPLHSGNSFLAMMTDKLASGEGVFAPRDEVRTPVDVHSLCAALLELAAGPHTGILHIGATEAVNRLELTRRLARALGYSTEHVREAPAQPDTGRAPRHKNGVLSVEKASRILQTPLLGLDETIARAVQKDLWT